jgi:hypothetical protein
MIIALASAGFLIAQYFVLEFLPRSSQYESGAYHQTQQPAASSSKPQFSNLEKP